MEDKNNINELRSILFETIRKLSKKEIDLNVAKTINDTAQVIINSAKVEIDCARVTDSRMATDFIPEQEKQKQLGGYVHKIGQGSSQKW